MSIIVEALYHTYHPGTPLETRAVENISFECGRGEWLSVVGHTGSGKSTLAQHLNGILLPERGSVTIDGMESREKSPHLREIRRSVGLVFQYPEQQLFAESVFEEIAFAPRNWGVPETGIPAIVSSSLSLAGLDESYCARSPFHLSGGEKRKVAIASVLAGTPSYLVLDEPTAGLDSWSRKELVSLLGRLKSEGLGILLVTHDLDIALQCSDSILMLDHGRGIVNDTPQKVMEHLQSCPVPGLHLPEIAALSSALRRKEPSAPLTYDWKELKRWIKNHAATEASPLTGRKS
jgi:energy-coupling factor transport system ATP-binding protein